jgi:curved DNA-binding protein CbpA
MNTLYDILGLGRSASAEQIERAYQERMESMKTADAMSSEESINRLRAIREAYLVLSAPQKRAVYDQKLKSRETVSYEVVESKSTPWAWILLSCAILIGGAAYYHSEQKKQQLAELELKAAKEKAEAEKAARAAEAQQAALERELLAKRQQEEAANQRLNAIAQQEGRAIHSELERAKIQAERDRDQKERVARQDEQRSQQEAEARSRNEIARMQRALSIPIARH